MVANHNRDQKVSALDSRLMVHIITLMNIKTINSLIFNSSPYTTGQGSRYYGDNVN